MDMLDSIKLELDGDDLLLEDSPEVVLPIQAIDGIAHRCNGHPGKDTTYVLDFVNDTEEILEAFKTYHTTAELSDVTDPHVVYNLRPKSDAAGHYDEFEVERVVAVELKPNATQGEFATAVESVVDRLHKEERQDKADRKQFDAAERRLASKAARKKRLRDARSRSLLAV